LRTIGASSGAVQRIFIMCGAFVGIAGTALGSILGIVICRNIVDIQRFIEKYTGGHVFDPGVFMLSTLPNTIDWPDVFRVVVLGLALSVLATLYPSWRAA